MAVLHHNFGSLQTDAHYSVLSLLLLLSGSPSNTDFTERPRVKEAGEQSKHTLRHTNTHTNFGLVQIWLLSAFADQQDTFDWAKYLMEGEDFDTGPYPDTPVSQPFPHSALAVNLHINNKNRIKCLFCLWLVSFLGCEYLIIVAEPNNISHSNNN